MVKRRGFGVTAVGVLAASMVAMLAPEATAATTPARTHAPSRLHTPVHHYSYARAKTAATAKRTKLTRATVSAQTTTSGLPSTVIAGYWGNWSDLRLRDIPTRYNVVYSAFAVGVPGAPGRVQFTPVYPASDFAADVAALKSQGRPVILSVGGWYDMPNESWGYRLSTSSDVSSFVNSVSALVSQYGFSGIDFDLEHDNFNVSAALSATRQLKKKYGSRFLITAAPAPWRQEYLQFAQQAGSLLDYVTPQYYDADLAEANSLQQMLDTTRQYVAAGIAPSKVGLAVRTVETEGSLADSPDTTTVATVNSAWQTLKAQYSTLRGVSLWSLNLDRTVGWNFASSALR